MFESCSHTWVNTSMHMLHVYMLHGYVIKCIGSSSLSDCVCRSLLACFVFKIRCVAQHFAAGNFVPHGKPQHSACVRDQQVIMPSDIEFPLPPGDDDEKVALIAALIACDDEEAALAAEEAAALDAEEAEVTALAAEAAAIAAEEAKLLAEGGFGRLALSTLASSVGASRPPQLQTVGASPRSQAAAATASVAATAILFGRAARTAALSVVSARGSGSPVHAAVTADERERAPPSAGTDDVAAAIALEARALAEEEEAEIAAEEASLEAEEAAVAAEEAAVEAAEAALDAEEAPKSTAKRAAAAQARIAAATAALGASATAEIAAEKQAAASAAREASARAAAAAAAKGLPPSPRAPSPRVADVRAQRASLQQSRTLRLLPRVNNPQLSRASAALLSELLGAVHGPKPQSLSSTVLC